MVAAKTTDEEILALIHEGLTNHAIAKRLKADEANIRRRCKRLRMTTEQHQSHDNFTQNKKGYLVTAAQNDTPVHGPFLRTLEAYCKRHGYTLIVIPLRYRNPTSPREDVIDRWHSSVEPYLCGVDVELAPGLKLMGSIKIQPTAVRPLSGLDTITGQDCGIFGHTKVALESVATAQGKLAKLLYTTGSVTKANYSDSKAGRKGEFHHVMGAVVVQRDGDLFHLRNIHAQSDGSFYDLDKRYSGEKMTSGHRAASITPGDIHAAELCKKTFAAFRAICYRLKPRRIIAHDVLDFGSASHHNTFMERFRRHHAGEDCIHSELLKTAQVMDEMAAMSPQLLIVASNHNDHFTKWLDAEKNANDLVNAWVYAETRAYYLRHLMNGEEPMSPLEFWARQMCDRWQSIRFLGRDETCTVHGVEHSYHGDKGPGGARGSTMNLSRIGAKVTKGHDHQAGIVDGCYSAGTFSRLDLDYTAGSPSAWINSMVVLYPNGKRTHIHVIDGRCGL